jgi:tetratricopeptide (TPR) repeat protein
MRILLSVLLLSCISFCNGQSADALYKKAIEYKNKKDFPAALVKIDAALKIDSSNYDYLTAKAECLLELKRYQESFDLLTKTIGLYPKKSLPYNNRGHLLITIQEFDYAIADFTSALAIAESDTIKNMLMVNRAAAKLNKRDFEGAYTDLKWSYDFDSTNIATLIDLAAICDEVGRGNETLPYLFRVIQLDSTSFPAYGNIGFKYQEMGDYKKAITYYNKVLELKPDEPLGYSNRSYNKYKLGDLKGAYADINRSIALYPANSYAYRIRALIAIEDKKTANACADIQKALDLGFTKMYGDEMENLKKKYCK